MSKTIRICLLTSVLTLVGASFVMWLITADSSPLDEYFLYNVSIPNTWMTLNLIPGLVSFIVGGHGGSEAVFLLAFAVQWLLVGLFLGLLLSIFAKR